MAAQSGKFLPVLAAVGGAEQGGVFNPGVDGFGIGQRRFQMPDPLEFPRMLRAVVPLVSAGDAVVGNLFPTGSQVLPPSFERWMTCPNQPLHCDAYKRFGSAGDPLTWKISHPAK